MPVSLVLSRSDQRLIALENGREIGRARIVVPPSATPPWKPKMLCTSHIQ